MTDQGSEETPTTDVPTPPVPPPAAPAYPPADQMPTYQQPAAYQQPPFAPPPAAYPPQPGYQQPGSPPPGYQQPAQPNWGQPPQQPPGPAWGQPPQQPPGQPNWGQPPQQVPGQPNWGQPQQPPAPAWSQPQPQYWGQPGGVVEYGHGTSVLAIIAGIPLLIYGLLITLGGAAVLFLGTALDDIVNQAGGTAAVTDAIKGAVTVIAIVILIVGILQVLAAIGIWAHKGWGRWLGIVFGVLGTLFGLLGVAGSRSANLNGTTASSNLGGVLFVLVPYAFVLIAMIIGGGHFHRKRVG